MKADLTELSREEWLKLRKLGSSDAATILGLNPFQTRFELWLEKTGQAPEREETEAMMWGKKLEAIIAEEFSRRMDLPVSRSQELFTHEQHPFMTATPDYFLDDLEGDENIAGLLEIKNKGAYASASWEYGPDDATHIQVMHQLAVTGLPYAYACALINGNKLVWHRIERDEEVIAMLIEREREFWQLVETKTPPPLSSGDSDVMNALYPMSESREVDLTPQARLLMETWALLTSQIEDLEEQKAILAAKLKEMMGSAERAVAGNFRISWKSVTSERLDTKSFRKDHPELAAKYLKPSTSRRFTIKNTATTEDNYGSDK